MRASIILIATLLVAHACARSFDEQTYRNKFTSWMQKHSKSYASHEFQSRYAIFKDNVDFVEQWNADKTHSHKVEANIFADLTNAEYQRIYLGTHIDATERLAKAATASVFGNQPSVSLPASVDWRQAGAVTPIKNQGQCGSCWSFSTTGSTEGIHKLSTGNLVSLSEQNLMDCSTSEGNNGCNGGLMDNAFKYIISNGGIDTEASYPYQGAQGSCQYNAANSGATIDSYQDVSSGDESALQTAAAQQPVSVAIDASHTSFQLYSSGVYYEAQCSSSQLDHGVLVIGYGTDSGSDFWLVKNSWGTTWGLSGYIEMSRNRNNNCGIATTASYPTISGATSGTAGSSSGSSSSSSGGNSGNSNSGGNSNSATSYTNGMFLREASLRAGGKGVVPKTLRQSQQSRGNVQKQLSEQAKAFEL